MAEDDGAAAKKPLSPGLVSAAVDPVPGTGSSLASELPARGSVCTTPHLETRQHDSGRSSPDLPERGLGSAPFLWYPSSGAEVPDLIQAVSGRVQSLRTCPPACWNLHTHAHTHFLFIKFATDIVV